MQKRVLFLTNKNNDAIHLKVYQKVFFSNDI
ncbi:hypothetical protein C8D70_101184 [Chryseobacterium sp. CBTAP 102]|nr:hypothetical protein C8D70_101184 [Chryseobacterium sp. CBTAP 102]